MRHFLHGGIRPLLESYVAEDIASALALSTLISILGAVTAAILDIRIGRFTPLLVAGMAQIICFYVMMNGMGAITFLAVLPPHRRWENNHNPNTDFQCAKRSSRSDSLH